MPDGISLGLTGSEGMENIWVHLGIGVSVGGAP